MENLKADIINNAYSELRISGLTVSATPGDNILALRKLESLAHELQARNIRVGYNFEDIPDPGSPSGILPQYQYSISIILAVRLLSDFGKGVQPDPTLMQSYSIAASFIGANTVRIKEVAPSSRMPIGSGSRRRWAGYSNFYPQVAQAPNSAKTLEMWVGDISPELVEDFQDILETGEDVVSYTITADSGLSLASDTLETPVIKYRVEALGNPVGSDSNRIYQRVVIKVETTTGTKQTRYINFNVMVNS